MNGILNVLKPPGMTSFDVVAYLRRILKIKRIGHTGTLDPGAVGVLPICVGSATKAIEYMTEKDKVYRAELTLGIDTDTQDSTGQVVKTSEIKVTRQQIQYIATGFVGKYQQIPPMYSAVKVNGQKLYDLARKGITVERKAREVEIYALDIININENERVKVLMDVSCSKGTYIRTLCADIGERLGCGGHMSFLVRLKAGSFGLDTAVTVEEIADHAQMGTLDALLTRVDQVFQSFPKLVLDPTSEKKFLNGVMLGMDGLECEEEGTYRVYNEGQVFIALGETLYKEEKKYLKSRKVF